MRSPAVFHCAAGKDRTGVLAALVLDAMSAFMSDLDAFGGAAAFLQQHGTTEAVVEDLRRALVAS